MTTTFLSGLVAFLIGLTGGSMLGEHNRGNTQSVTPRSTLSEVEAVTDTLYAQDFVSMRPAITTLPSESLSIEEKDDLTFMREEEKLARDVYATLYETWNLPIFANIAQSEQTHTEAVRDLLTKYGIDDPVDDDSIGVFANSELASLYAELIEKGSTSQVEALRVGALIEDLDIRDLGTAIERTDNNDITRVYSNLKNGSENHMRAFTRQLSLRDETYTPLYIPPAMYESILSEPQGNGRSHGQGGRGWGGQ